MNNDKGLVPQGPNTDFSEIRAVIRHRISEYSDNKPHSLEAVMSAIIWGAATASIAHESAYRFKHFADQFPKGCEFILKNDGKHLTITTAAQQLSGVSASTTLVFELDKNGAVI